MAKGGIDGANTNINNKAASYTVASHTTTTLNSYAIGTVVSSVNNTSVYLSGVYQNKNEYILANSSSNIQFKDASLVSSLSLEIITIR
jgi:archaellum component FlaF (FlaF/FlaG flagellin family)